MNFKIITVALLFTSPALSAYAEYDRGNIRKAKKNSGAVSQFLGEDENPVSVDQEDKISTHEKTLSHLNKVDTDSRQLQAPSRNCLTHTIFHPFNAAHGTCRSYLHENSVYCDNDKNSKGILAQDACSECGKCVGPNHKCIAYGNGRPFDANWGRCETYAPGNKNHFWCDKDVDSNNIRADEACSECGDCEKSNPRTVTVYIDYLKCLNEADGFGKTEEIYGYLNTRVGGYSQTLWDKSSKSAVSIEEGKSHYIKQTRTFNDVSDLEHIVFGGHLREDDLFWDDNLGYKSQSRQVGDLYGAGKTVVPVYWGHGGDTHVVAYYHIEVS